jgi:phospholipid/cholesterol/gamma-HCH transport system substrate-binding protein
MAEITIRISDKALKVVGVTLGGSCLVWVVFYICSSGFFVPKYHLRMYVPESEGLAVGAPTRLDGMQVGAVDSIKLVEASATPERRIELTLRVEKPYQDEIRADSTASLTTEGLLGQRYVSIRRGFNGTPIPPGGEIAAAQAQEATIRNLIDSLAKTIQTSGSEKHEPREKPHSR